MKAVILAGGLGTRLSEETATRPKPMVEIGGHPILWHVMSIYARHGIQDFIVCAGYKGVMIKKYFSDYFMHQSDVTFDLAANRVEFHTPGAEPWRVTVVDTGEHSMTGGRLARVASHLDDETFCMTYGDGLANIDIKATLELHRREGKQATLTAVQPPGRFGALRFSPTAPQQIAKFEEKPDGDGSWINGGFFVLEPDVLDLISGDNTVWEQAPLQTLAQRGQLAAYRHSGFWQPMDTLRDKNELQTMWDRGNPPWLRSERPRLRLAA